MRISFFFLWFIVLIFPACAQSGQNLEQIYERYKETAIRQRRFKISDIEPLIKKLGPSFQVKQAGASVVGRPIYRVTTGSGPVKVLLWSQMHGDESTATMALFDIFRFLQGKGDGFDDLREKLQNELTLIFIPMLNPDGAERFTRRNALGIDINRDAVRLQSPESQLLKQIRDETGAEWGFNLHDQSRYTAAGQNEKTAAVSFLAPPVNYEKEVNDTRKRAMQLIGLMNEDLQAEIPGQVARYNDDFEPRAFGDNMQIWGTSTVLIESGGLSGDPEKQRLRKMNFLAILKAFGYIADKRYADVPLEAYDRIPFNRSNSFFDVIVRGAEVTLKGKQYTVDIGIRGDEVDYNDGRSYYVRSAISDFGDLSTFHAYQEIPAQGLAAIPGKVYPTVLPNLAAAEKLDYRKLWQQGYTAVQVSGLSSVQTYRPGPLQLLKPGGKPDSSISLGRNPGLILRSGGKVMYAVVNGQVFEN